MPPVRWIEPEVAAEAIVWAAHHRRRELYVGGPTVQAIWANTFVPGLLDWYLGVTGYDAQQTNQPVLPNRPDNLFQPVPGDAGAHGIFAERACITSPGQLSEELRHGGGEFLEERRAVTSLSLFSAGIMGLIGLYQMGILKSLPEPPLPRMDTDRVNASDEAYSYFSVPDAWLGFISYGVTAALAAAGPKDRWKSAPLLPLALAGKALADTAVAGKLTIDQWTKHKAFCIWCLLSAGATVATVPLVWKEASAAWRTLFGSR